MKRGLIAAIVLVNAVVVACGGRAGPARSQLEASAPRHCVVWLGEDGIDEEYAAQLWRVGVDEVVVRRGQVNLSSGVPVLRFSPAPPVAGPIRAGLALTVEGAPADLDPGMARVLWSGLVADIGDATPAELILDLPSVPAGFGGFISRLSAESGLPVVPVLTVDQLASEEATEVIRAAGACLIPTHGSVELFRRGAEPLVMSLQEKLESLAEMKVRVRLGVVMVPRCEPSLGRWGDELGPVAQGDVVDISTSSTLDRTLVFKTDVEWSGRTWRQGERVALRWTDAARLDASLREIGRLVLPELGGWDLISLPPTPTALGLGRDALVAYLGGDGPAPEFEVRALRRGRTLRVRVVNSSPFATAVSSYGNWLQVSLRIGALVVEGRGSLDRVVVGSVKNGAWRQISGGAADAVRFSENYIGPGEELETGVIRLPSNRSRATIRWHMLLSTGEEVTGVITS